MALAALCSDDDWGKSWAEIMQYRFTSDGAMGGHAIGNLLLAALWDRDPDPVIGLDRVGSLLKVIGRVLPMASVPLDIEGTFNTSAGPIVVRGQKEVATATGQIESLRIIPDNPPARAEALSAISGADWITMGPGSWFSSVMPHLLVPEQRAALEKARAKKIVILNLDADPSKDMDEFAGSSPEEHVGLFHRYAPQVRIDYFLVDACVARNESSLRKAAYKCGGEIVITDLRKECGSARHSSDKLALTLGNILGQNLLG